MGSVMYYFSWYVTTHIRAVYCQPKQEKISEVSVVSVDTLERPESFKD